jgi:integrative and conjugative element protein (TIGR02256 family)
MIKHIFTFDDLSPIKNILIEDIVVKNMRSYQQSEKGLPEACGILMGEKRGINQEYLILKHISTPQPSDIRQPYYYRRQANGHQEILNHYHKLSNGAIQYMGEWHTHPQKIAKPSLTDYMAWLQTCNFFTNTVLVFYIVGNEQDWIGIQINERIFEPIEYKLEY